MTLSRSLIVPFLQFSPRRDLREKAFRAWVARGENGGATDNRAVVAETLALREERARLLGYPDFASYKLEPEMAGTPGAVRDLLMAVWAPARARAEADAEQLAELMRADGVNGALEPWDWRYYAAIRQAREHDFDESALKPYLPLDGMLRGRLRRGRAAVRTELPPDRGRALSPGCPGLGGAARATGTWGSSSATISRARPSGREPGARRSAASAGSTARCGRSSSTSATSPRRRRASRRLLTFDDAHTLFHEMGHALHGLLSDVTYEFISGTSVARDFVELPSQLYEHWLETPEVLEAHARHATTGEPMPRETDAAADRGAELRPGLLDGRVSRLGAGRPRLPCRARRRPTRWRRRRRRSRGIGMPRAIVMRHAAPHFQHVFSGDGYSSGLLFLHVVGGDGRRRLRRLPRDGRRLRPGDGEAPGRLHPERRRIARGGRALHRLPWPACPGSRRCCSSAAWSRRPRRRRGADLARYHQMSRCGEPTRRILAQMRGIA